MAAILEIQVVGRVQRSMTRPCGRRSREGRDTKQRRPGMNVYHIYFKGFSNKKLNQYYCFHI